MPDLPQPISNFDKTNFLETLTQAINSEQISKNEVLEAVNKSTHKATSGNLPVKILSILGAVISILGIIFFVNQIWNNLGDWGQILITLGTGLLFFISGIFLMLEKSPKFISLSIHLIGAVLIPFGISVTLSKLPIFDNSILLINFLVFSALAMVYLTTDFFLKSNLFTTATYIFGTISYFSLVSWILRDQITSLDFRVGWTFTAIYGVVLAILPRILEIDFREKTYKFFEGVGYLAFFISLFGIVFDTPLEIVAVFTYITGIFLGSQIKSSSLLTFSFLAITSYILYVNGRYFTEFIGWPVGLMLSGFILILSGYIFSKMNKKDLSGKA